MIAQYSMLVWKLCDFSGDTDQYCKETLLLCDFSGGGDMHMIDHIYMQILHIKIWVVGHIMSA